MSLTQSQELADQDKREGEAEYLSPSKYACKKVGANDLQRMAAPKQKVTLLMPRLRKHCHKGQDQKALWMHPVWRLLATLCNAGEMSNGECRLIQDRICACLFMAGHVDSTSSIEAVEWQAVWRHGEWMLWRHCCMFQAPDLL